MLNFLFIFGFIFLYPCSANPTKVFFFLNILLNSKKSLYYIFLNLMEMGYFFAIVLFSKIHIILTTVHRTNIILSGSISFRTIDLVFT